jgi:serine/threonine protein kinase
VYLAEVRAREKPSSEGAGVLVAAKVMDRKELEGRNKEGRARTEREILEAVDHPFLPKLHGVADGDRWSCLLTEFCPGGDLHVLRQRQPHRRFPEAAVRYVQAIHLSHHFICESIVMNPCRTPLNLNEVLTFKVHSSSVHFLRVTYMNV